LIKGVVKRLIKALNGFSRASLANSSFTSILKNSKYLCECECGDFGKFGAILVKFSKSGESGKSRRDHFIHKNV
jgi:hypothetical protein